ncbi:Tudor domain-containing protein [Dirofilaria immitis]
MCLHVEILELAYFVGSKMHEIDNDKWAIRNNRDVVPVSTERGYIQKAFFYKCLLRSISKDLDNFGLLYHPIRLALATRVQMSNLPPLLLPVTAGEYIRARISYVADSERLFVQLENNARTILKIGERLKNLAKQKHEPLCNPECGTIVAALYSLDRCYYRASVFSKTGIDTIAVFYIDYGNMAYVNINDSFLLKDAYLLSIPPQAIQLIIDGVTKPRLIPEQIRSLLTDQTVGAQINDVTDNGESFIANLFVKNERNMSINLKEVILGERPAPTLSLPKPVTIDNLLDMENDLVDYMDQNNGRGINSSKISEEYNFSGDSLKNHFDSGWERTCKNNYKTTGFQEQSCDDGSYSSLNNFRSNYVGGSAAPRVADRRTYRNSDEYGRFAHECTVFHHKNDFRRGKRDNGSGTQRFVGNGNFGSSHSDSNRARRRNGGAGRCFGESRGGRSHLLERRKQSLCSFLDRDTRDDDTATDKSGWKSGNWTSSTSNAESQSNFSSVGFEKKIDLENWNVNEGGWKLNDTNCDLVDNRSQIEKISENATITSTQNYLDGTGNHRNVKSNIESIKSSENLLINTSSISLSPHLEVDNNGEVNGTTTMGNEDLSSYRLSSVTISHIESSSLEEIKFGDVVGGLRSDGLEKSDPLSFFVQLDRDKNNIEHLVLSNARLPANLPKLSSFEISQACIAPFMGNYYRAEITGEQNNNKKKILFVDYGNVEDVDTSELYFINNSLPEKFHTSRRMAFHCRLYGVMPVAFKDAFEPEARRIFSELTADQKLLICFLQQSVKSIYEVSIMLSNGHFVSDILISRGFAIPFKWGIGPSLPLYETLDVVRSDEFDHVHPIFTIQLSDSLVQLERLNNGYVDTKKTVEVPQIGNVVISYFDDSPYRAEIIDMKVDSSNTIYRVRYVDYGNESLCTKEELFVLDRDQQPDEILYTPRQGIRCRIDGIRPLNHTKEWPTEVQECIDSLLTSSTSFEAIAGSPDKNGVYPIKVVVFKNQLTEENDSETIEADENNANNKIELASWLVAKSYAEMDDVWRDYPVKNLLSDGEREYEMFITEVDGQIIRARPCVFVEEYNKMKKALANIEIVSLATSAVACLITLDNENKRAMLIPSENNLSSRKCLLVDEGIFISIDEMSVKFCVTRELYDSDGFLIRTCHWLSVQLKFTEFLLDEKFKQIILSSAGNDPVKVVLVEYSEDSYLINDIFFSDGTTLIEKLKEAQQKETGENESAPDFVASDLEQASRSSSSQDESRSPIIEMKQIECSEDLVTDENLYLSS